MPVWQIGLLLLMVTAGFAIGLAYFYGLWFSLRRFSPGKKGWGPRMMIGFFVRAGLLAAAFFLLMGNDWKRLIALTVGLWAARLIMLQRVKNQTAEKRNRDVA